MTVTIISVQRNIKERRRKKKQRTLRQSNKLKIFIKNCEIEIKFIRYHRKGVRKYLKMSEVKKFSLAQVKEHNKNKDVWIVIRDKVYDVTKFLSEVRFFCSSMITCKWNLSLKMFLFFGIISIPAVKR